MYNNDGPDQDYTIYDAILKLEEALFLEPYHHEAFWYLGYSCRNLASSSDPDEMDYYAKKAAMCYQRAFELDSLNVIYRRSFELYCKDLQDFAPDQQSTRITESSPSSVTKTQKEKDILKYDMLNGKITKPKKSKASLSENQELLDELKKMRENQEKTNLIMENMMSFIQNRFSGEDVNAIIQASRQLSYIILLVVFIFTLLVC
ncbi:mitochondrial import receptor subunit TOM20 [Medicago truncatula]|uniref:mitochondrial import receptor subunit TOM20 n=1 Tax=Medicago truncatula TaxID=3880 RepID=UPI0019689B99|nr:mitochondrial import receptor subunit TOM20-like [Medicago truncatula]